ncbi:MAG: hypothetical protein ACM359_23515 [Bacillota bacterium]
MRNHPTGIVLVLMIVLVAVASVARAADDQSPHKLKLSDCPRSVQKTFEVEAKGTKIETVEADVEDGEAWYTADVTIKGKKYTITVDQDGILIDKLLGNDEEKQLKLADCPKAVQNTLKEETQGFEIGKVVREKQHGVVSYYARVNIQGNRYWITVDEDGTLISKSLDDSEDDGDQDRSVPQRSRTV